MEWDAPTVAEEGWVAAVACAKDHLVVACRAVAVADPTSGTAIEVAPGVPEAPLWPAASPAIRRSHSGPPPPSTGVVVVGAAVNNIGGVVET